MNQATTFTAPSWDKCEERDVTGDLFLDLDPDGNTTVFALFHEEGVPWHSGEGQPAILEGVRVEHPGLTEWVDAASLIAMFGRQEFYAAQEWVAS